MQWLRGTPMENDQNGNGHHARLRRPTSSVLGACVQARDTRNKLWDQWHTTSQCIRSIPSGQSTYTQATYLWMPGVCVTTTLDNAQRTTTYRNRHLRRLRPKRIRIPCSRTWVTLADTSRCCALRRRMAPPSTPSTRRLPCTDRA